MQAHRVRYLRIEHLGIDLRKSFVRKAQVFLVYLLREDVHTTKPSDDRLKMHWKCLSAWLTEEPAVAKRTLEMALEFSSAFRTHTSPRHVQKNVHSS